MLCELWIPARQKYPVLEFLQTWIFRLKPFEGTFHFLRLLLVRSQDYPKEQRRRAIEPRRFVVSELPLLVCDLGRSCMNRTQSRH